MGSTKPSTPSAGLSQSGLSKSGFSARRQRMVAHKYDPNAPIGGPRKAAEKVDVTSKTQFPSLGAGGGGKSKLSKGKGFRVKRDAVAYDPNAVPEPRKDTGSRMESRSDPRVNRMTGDKPSMSKKSGGFRVKREAVAYNPDEVDMTKPERPPMDQRPVYGQDRRPAYSASSERTSSGLSSRSKGYRARNLADAPRRAGPGGSGGTSLSDLKFSRGGRNGYIPPELMKLDAASKAKLAGKKPEPESEPKPKPRPQQRPVPQQRPAPAQRPTRPAPV